MRPEQEALFLNESTAVKENLYSRVKSLPLETRAKRVLGRVVRDFAKQALQSEDYIQEPLDDIVHPEFGIELNDFLTTILSSVLPKSSSHPALLRNKDREKYIQMETAKKTEWINILTLEQKREIFRATGLDIDWGYDCAQEEKDSEDDFFCWGNDFMVDGVTFIPVMIAKDGKSIISIATKHVTEDEDEWIL